MKSFLVLFALFCCLSSLAMDKNKLDALFLGKMNDAQVSGMQMAFTQNDKLSYSGHLGYTDFGGKNAISEGTTFYSASMTKMLTAIAILQLIEQGKIRLEDKVVQHLPWLSLHESRQALEITIGQLMSHTSGMSRNGVSFWTDESRWQEGTLPTEAELKKAALNQTFSQAPGSHIKYSNIGFELLGHIVGKVCVHCKGRTATQRYMNYVKENILIPLNMKHSGFVPGRQLKNFATPYGRIGEDGQRQALPLISNAGASVGGWGLYSTASEFILFVNEIGKVALNSRNKLLTTDVSQLIAQPVAWDYVDSTLGHSYGFRILKTNKGILIGHSGTFPGYSSAGFYSLSDKTAGVVYLNTIDTSGIGFLMEAFTEATGEKRIPGETRVPEQTLAPAMPENPFKSIVGKYFTEYGSVEVIFENDRYFILQSKQKIPLYLSITPDGQRLEGRIGTNGGYFDWTGDAIQFHLDDTGKVTRVLAAKSILTYPVPPPRPSTVHSTAPSCLGVLTQK